MAELMQRLRLDEDSAAIPNNSGIDPVFIDIAVEYFSPETAPRESDAIAESIEGLYDLKNIRGSRFNRDGG
jgi:hypothetical protein